MKLATFVHDDNERFGIILTHPATGEDWVFDPNLVQERLTLYASRGTSPLNANPPQFFEGPIPSGLANFLAVGQSGMDYLRRMTDFLTRFLEQADQYILRGAGFPLAEVRLRAPIPRPRLFYGLVQNSPTAWRSRPERAHLNLFPQGHQRPQGSVLGPGDPVVLPYVDPIVGGWNPELGVILGRGGRDIPVDQAMSYVAGLTIVSDVTFDYFRRDYFAQESPFDWFEDAMSSWGDKKSDGRTPMGPYLVTLDAVGNPYDLLIYTRQNGLLRDRSHTGAMALGIERTIHFLSGFMTLFPGDVIHMGTMGYDGSPHLSDFIPGPDDTLESEIERLGVLRNPLVVPHPDHDWREETDPSRSIHPAPAVRDLIADNADTPSLDNWSVEQVNHVWLVFGNYADAETQQDMKRRPYPRFLCAPNTVLTANTNVNDYGGSLGCELAFIVGRLATNVSVEEAEDYILGYAPMLSLYDPSFEENVIEPASMQERYLPQVYGRWRDGYNIIGTPQAMMYPTNTRCVVFLDDGRAVEGNTAEYIQTAPQVLAYISRYITLFPGDVITLGRLAQRLDLNGATSVAGTVEIEGIGEFTFRVA